MPFQPLTLLTLLCQNPGSFFRNVSIYNFSCSCSVQCRSQIKIDSFDWDRLPYSSKNISFYVFFFSSCHEITQGASIDCSNPAPVWLLLEYLWVLIDLKYGARERPTAAWRRRLFTVKIVLGAWLWQAFPRDKMHNCSLATGQTKGWEGHIAMEEASLVY